MTDTEQELGFRIMEQYGEQAKAQLDRYCRIYRVREPWPGAFGKAVEAMAEVLYNADQTANGAGAPQSMTIGSVRVDYGSTAAQAVDASPAGVARALYQAACRYLDIYRG